MAVSNSNIGAKVEQLREQLGCPLLEKDSQGSDFWYLRPGVDEESAAETRPIAVKFYDELNLLSAEEIKRWLTEEKQPEIYNNHYIDRVNENQPAMYLLYPTSDDSGRVAFVLPQEGGVKQRHIQSFGLIDDRNLGTRLDRLRAVPIAQNILCSVPLVERVFYDPIKTAKELAQKLARSAREIEKLIPKLYEKESNAGYLNKLLKSFQQELLPNLQVQPANDKDYSFADIYAQTVAYALFTARVFGHIKDKKEGKVKETHFDRESAWQQLPETNPFLRKLFEDISKQTNEELGSELISAIEDIFAILRAAKMETILQDFQQQANREDIIIHFYEPFLAAYKPKMREGRGVYYTPEPVVSYMVRSVDILLKDKFNKPLGLADPEVMILDPACGTGTFLLWICQLIHDRFHSERAAIIESVGDISWSEYVSKHLLPRIFGFELLMAPYAIAHLKLGLFLEETGYQFDGGKRLGVYLTNTLDDAIKKTDVLFQEYISEESHQAISIKTDEKVMVVIGNPPYSAKSQNLSDNARKWINDYRYVDENLIKEKGALQFEKNLQDDYIKFFRFAQSRIDRTGHGILAFVSNHTYLDSISLRGMRESLSKTFDCTFLLNLHGNSKRKEKCPDLSKDENIFDIQQGVSIGLFTKGLNQNNFLSKFHHNDLYGVEKLKSAWLGNNNIDTTIWNSIKPTSPNYLFIPQNKRMLDEYAKGWLITDIMAVNSAGIISARDNVVIDFEEDPILKRVQFFRDSLDSNEVVCERLNISQKKGWDIQKARTSIRKENNLQQLIQSITYRPFDNRVIFYHDSLVWTTAKKVMRNMLAGENLGLIVAKQTKEEWHVLASNQIIGHKALAAYDVNSLFPLYIYPTTQAELDMEMSRRPNLSPEFLTKIQQNLGYQPTPEAIFYYIYAIFHSPTYRSRYAEFLKIDFPRVPLTSDDKLFKQLATFGEKLVNLHLMKSIQTGRGGDWTTGLGGNSSAEVGAGYPKYESGKVTINKQGEGFINVPEAVWKFHVGGYQVCHKWLKDRKGRILSAADIAHYQGIVSALGETIEVMQQIDKAIPGFPIQ